MRTPRANHLWLIGAAAAVVYFILRSTTDFVWDDTLELYLLPPDAIHRLRPLVDVFRSISLTSNYRPLAGYVAAHALALVGSGALNVQLWLAAMAAVVGGAAAAVFAVATRLLDSELWALVATVLFLCSPAFVTGSWVVLAGQQPMVPLLMCLGLLLYLRLDEARGWRRAIAVGGLAAILLLGPWYREFFLVIAVLVVLEEARRRRRPTWIMGLGALGIVHALFPMLLPKWLVDPALPVIPIPFLGDVGTQLGKPHSGGQALRLLVNLRGLRYGVSAQLAALFPPSLAALSLLGFGLRSLRGVRASSGTSATRASLSPRWTAVFRKVREDRTVAASACLAALVVMLIPVLLLAHPVLTRATPRLAAEDVVIAAIFTLYGWSVSPLLGLWMVLTLAPLYWVYTEIVHLAYPLVPASIIAAAGLRECWLALRRLEGPRARPLRYAFAVVTTILVMDQVLDVYGAWHVVRQSTAGMRAVAAALRRDVPQGAVVIGNVIHLYDIDRYAAGWFRPYFTVRAGTPGPYADTPAAVASLLSRHLQTTYLLDASQPYLPDQYAYHSHPLVRSHAVDRVDLGSLHETRAVYPFLDPLQALIPRAFVPFLGAPDLVQDFYRGPALNGLPFLREVYVEYHVYRVTGTTVRPW